jgi:hypothetical protein
VLSFSIFDHKVEIRVEGVYRQPVTGIADLKRESAPAHGFALQNRIAEVDDIALVRFGPHR